MNHVAQPGLAFLAEASSLLSASLDYQVTLNNLARLAVPTLADWCVVFVREPGRVAEPVAVAHHYPELDHLVSELSERYPFDPDAPHGIAKVLRTGQPEFIPEIPEELVSAVARDRVFGALSFMASHSGRRFTADDVALAEELARRAAVAVDNARLFREMQAAEQRFRNLVEGLDAIVWEADPRTLRFSFVSRPAGRLLGYPAERWTSTDDFWPVFVHPADLPCTLARLRAALDGHTGQDFEFRAVAADGRPLWLRAAVYLAPADGGDVPQLRGLMVDVTPRKTAERRQEAQHAVVGVLAESPSLEEAAPRILEAIAGSLDWQIGALWTPEPGQEVLRARALWQAPGTSAPSFTEMTRRVPMPRGVGLPGRVWATGQPAWIRDVIDDCNFPRVPVARREGLHGAFAFPVTSNEGFLGVVEFFSPEVREPDVDLLRMTASIGSQLGQFMEHKRAEAARLATEERLRFKKTLLESQSEATIDGILVVSPEGRMLSFNRRFVEMWGMPADVIASRSDQAGLDAVLDMLLDPEEFLRRVRYLYDHPDEASREEIALRDGRIFDRWSAPLRSADGVYYGRAWYFRDITETKNTELALEHGREQLRFLAEASALLSASLDSSRVLERVAELIVPALADWCAVDVPEEDGSIARIAVTHGDPSLRDVARRLKDFPPDPASDHPVVHVLRRGRSYVAREITDDFVRSIVHDVDHLNVVAALAARSIIVVPLLARGRTLGAITMATSRREYEASDLALAEDIAHRAALAMDNARLYEERSHVARTLQESLLPPHLPDIAGVEVAARYQPASGEGNEVGGDFYDLFQTSPDAWMVVMGDVCGKGAEAAAITALVRYTVRAGAMREPTPARILSLLNEAILRQRSDKRFCTVAAASLRPGRDHAGLRIACGGHPLPLVVRADGAVETAGRPGTVLGLFDDPELHDADLRLGPGDALLLYTDGVTEARGEGRDIFGEDRLRQTVAGYAGATAEQIAQDLEERVLAFQSGRPRDDVAILVIRVPT